MHRSLIVVLIVVLLLAACAPAATPTSAPAQPAAPAQPTRAPEPTKAAEPTHAPAAAAPIGTQVPTSAPAEVRPPASGGVLNPPTLSPTAIGSRANVNNNGWITYRDKVYGLAFQYPPDWTFATQTAPP